MKALSNNMRVAFDIEGNLEITFTLKSHPRAEIDDLRAVLDNDRDLSVEVKQHRKKRSLDANGMLWAVVNEIANVLRASKEEVYLDMLKKYGQCSVVSIVDEAVETFLKSVKYAEVIGEGTLNDKEFTHIKVFMGSSEFDSREMAILIDGALSDAKELGIEVMAPQDVALLKEEWGQK